jgi:hypothetical protein
MVIAGDGLVLADAPIELDVKFAKLVPSLSENFKVLRFAARRSQNFKSSSMNGRCQVLGTSSGTSMMGASWPQKLVPCFVGRLGTQSLADRVPASAIATIARPLPG